MDTPRKIIQITAGPNGLYALADDGAVFHYTRDTEAEDEGTDGSSDPLFYWHEMLPIPGTESYTRWQNDILERSIGTPEPTEPDDSRV